MIEIKHVYVIGSSYSAGGGFEENSWMRKKLQEFMNEPIPEKMIECAWPWFFSKMISNSTEVINESVPGAGIEHLIRTTNAWIQNNPSKVENTLFLLEITGFGRNEYWSNTLGKPILVNWDYGVRKKEFACTVHSGNYWKDHISTRMYFENQASPLMEEWMNEFLGFQHELERLQSYLFNFLTFLNYKQYKFKLFGEKFVDDYYNKDLLCVNNFLELISKKGICAKEIYHFLEIEEYQIKQFTNGYCDDFHATLDGNKEIARQYYNQISKEFIL